MKIDPLPLLTLVALICTTLVGFAGVVKDYRNRQTNRLTRVGRWLLAITSFAALLGGITIFLDFRQRAAESNELRERTAKLLTNIERSLTPLRDMNVGFALDSTGKSPELQRELQRIAKQNHEVCLDPSNGSAFTFDGPTRLSTKFKKLVPQVYVELYFIRGETHPSQLNLLMNGRLCFGSDVKDCPQLMFDPDLEKERSTIQPEWDECLKTLTFYGHEVGKSIGNGRIVSVNDLAGVQIVAIPSQIISTDSFSGGWDDEANGLNLRSLSLQIAGYNPFDFPDTAWKKITIGAENIYSHTISKQEIKDCCSESVDKGEVSERSH
jgi:hypothetical protein